MDIYVFVGESKESMTEAAQRAAASLRQWNNNNPQVAGEIIATTNQVAQCGESYNYFSHTITLFVYPYEDGSLASAA